MTPTQRRAGSLRQRRNGRPYDVAVIGAGAFGSWIALDFCRLGQRVALIDGYGPGNSRASSGGESRVIRVAYGADEIYSRWAIRALQRWTGFFEEVNQSLFHKTGVLWMARERDPISTASASTLQKLGVPHERLDRADLEVRYPQMDAQGLTWAILEPASGVLLSRRAVQAVVWEAVRKGLTLVHGAVDPPTAKDHLERITFHGDDIEAETFVFACGPWLPKVFPDLLADRIFPTRQEVFYFGPEAGDERFRPPAMPVWIDFGEEFYGMPDIESRGFKVALDRHGPRFDPDSGEREITPETLAEVRGFLSRRFPALKAAPLVGSEVCQYENTSNGDFLIDRHPDLDNVWLVGGGSGHGFKHGPAVSEYLLGQVRGEEAETRFTIETKATTQGRSVH